MKKASALFVVLVGVSVAILGGYLRFKQVSRISEANTIGKLQVMATFYPLADFAQQIGGDDIELRQIVPDGIEPHEYEPTAQQIASASSADVFLMNGGGVDAWADDVAAAVKERGGTVVEMSEVIELHANDPHIWLEPTRAKAMLGYIENAFIAKDGDHRDEYAIRSAEYRTKLEALDQRYEAELAHCSLRDIIVSHDAFEYLGARYTFTVHHILGVSPEEEPSVKAITDLAKLAKDLHITTIFFETLVSPKLAQTLAAEVGARAEVLNPIEGLTTQDREAGKGYIDLMNENLTALKSAMMCQ